MSTCEEFIETIASALPSRCTVDDLIKAGLYPSRQAAYASRKKGDTPTYFRLGAKIIFPKSEVIDWVKQKKHEGCVKKDI